MNNNNKKEKFNREKCRQEIAKRYNDEINELKRRIGQLEEEKIVANELIKQQQTKINEQEERINLYRMVVDMPEKDIVELINKSKTKADFLDAMHIFGKILKEY